MLRALVLAALAAVAALFAAALLRAEGRGAAPTAAGSCTARTRSGAPCSRAAEPGADRCWQHR